MRERVFSDAAARRSLEALLHPMIRAESERQIAAAAGPYVLYVVPLLVESGSQRERVDRVLVVDCPEPVQVERVRARSGLSEEQAMGMVVNGFIEPITRTLPMEYAVEWSRLIELQMEGSVG